MLIKINNFKYVIIALLLVSAGILTADTSDTIGPIPFIEEELVPPVDDPFEELAPFLHPEEQKKGFNYQEEFLHMLYVLGSIIGIVLIVAWLLKRFVRVRMKQINHNNLIKILESRNLSPKSSIYLIEVMEKNILISDSASGVQFLTECPPFPITDQEEEPQLAKEKLSFSQIFHKIRKNKEFYSKLRNKNILKKGDTCIEKSEGV